jgi:hypothetical protein
MIINAQIRYPEYPIQVYDTQAFKYRHYYFFRTIERCADYVNDNGGIR